jgi:WhiB family redox-sensing transcriptional regulator
MPKRDWRDDAYCIDMPSHIFYGKTEDSMTAAEIAYAKTVCARCPVRRDCLIYALKNQEPYGVWGGFATFERRTALKRNNGEHIYAVVDYDNGEFIKPRTRNK